MWGFLYICIINERKVTMNKFECLCAHINCGNGIVAGWTHIDYEYVRGTINVTVTLGNGCFMKKSFTSGNVCVKAANFILKSGFVWKNQVR